MKTGTLLAGLALMLTTATLRLPEASADCSLYPEGTCEGHCPVNVGACPRGWCEYNFGVCAGGDCHFNFGYCGGGCSAYVNLGVCGRVHPCWDDGGVGTFDPQAFLDCLSQSGEDRAAPLP